MKKLGLAFFEPSEDPYAASAAFWRAMLDEVVTASGGDPAEWQAWTLKHYASGTPFAPEDLPILDAWSRSVGRAVRIQQREVTSDDAAGDLGAWTQDYEGFDGEFPAEELVLSVLPDKDVVLAVKRILREWLRADFDRSRLLDLLKREQAVFAEAIAAAHPPQRLRILRLDGSVCTELDADGYGKLNGALLYEVDLAKAVLDGIGFSAAQVGRANFEGASLRDAVFYWAECVETNFTSADLRGADFRGARLQKALFDNSKLESANFGRADLLSPTKLNGVDLSVASVEGASFLGATYDSTTRFPDGFDPAEHQMVLVD